MHILPTLPPFESKTLPVLKHSWVIRFTCPMLSVYAGLWCTPTRIRHRLPHAFAAWLSSTRDAITLLLLHGYQKA
jgi:hypothetical protein